MGLSPFLFYLLCLICGEKSPTTTTTVMSFQLVMWTTTEFLLHLLMQLLHIPVCSCSLTPILQQSFFLQRAFSNLYMTQVCTQQPTIHWLLLLYTTSLYWLLESVTLPGGLCPITQLLHWFSNYYVCTYKRPVREWVRETQTIQPILHCHLQQWWTKTSTKETSYAYNSWTASSYKLTAWGISPQTMLLLPWDIKSETVFMTSVLLTQDNSCIS